MAHDFQKKEPSKTEKLIYELFMQQQQMERGLWSTSAHVVALALALGADPVKVGEFMADEAKMKEYSEKVNEVMNKLQKEKQPVSPETVEGEHNHTHEGGEHHHEAGTKLAEG
jgi:hypothetical protein